MLRLVRAEFLKLRTTQVWIWMLLLAVAISAVAVIAGLAGNDVTSSADIPGMLANANGVLMTLYILGVLGLTTEFRYQTITPAVLATPSRWRLVGAKLITYWLVGLAFGLVCLAVQLAIALPWLSSKGIDFAPSDPDLRKVLIGLPVIFALFAIFGVGMGALMRNQIVALVVGLVFLLVIENIVGAIPKVKNVFPYLPVGAVTEFLYPPSDLPDDVPLISATGGFLVLLAWGLVPAAIGAASTMRRDIT